MKKKNSETANPLQVHIHYRSPLQTTIKKTHKATITAKPPSHKPTITDPQTPQTQQTQQTPGAAINQEL